MHQLGSGFRFVVLIPGVLLALTACPHAPQVCGPSIESISSVAISGPATIAEGQSATYSVTARAKLKPGTDQLITACFVVFDEDPGLDDNLDVAVALGSRDQVTTLGGEFELECRNGEVRGKGSLEKFRALLPDAGLPPVSDYTGGTGEPNPSLYLQPFLYGVDLTSPESKRIKVECTPPPPSTCSVSAAGPLLMLLAAFAGRRRASAAGRNRGSEPNSRETDSRRMNPDVPGAMRCVQE